MPTASSSRRRRGSPSTSCSGRPTRSALARDVFAAGEPVVDATGADPRPDRRPGGVGGRRDLRTQPRGPRRGVERRRRRVVLRPGLRRRPSRAVPEGHSAPGRRTGRGGPHPRRLAVERPRAGADAGRQRGGHDLRLHDRQRHVEPRHRGREPALPAPGQDLRRLGGARPAAGRRPTVPPPTTRRSRWRSSGPGRSCSPARPRSAASGDRCRRSSSGCSATTSSRTAAT